MPPIDIESGAIGIPTLTCIEFLVIPASRCPPSPPTMLPCRDPDCRCCWCTGGIALLEAVAAAMSAAFIPPPTIVALMLPDRSAEAVADDAE